MKTGKAKTQARLRLVKSEDLDLCSSYSFTADIPFGSTVLPHSMSLMADGDRSVTRPMAARVMPVPRRSDTTDDQSVSVDMSQSLRLAVDSRQRLAVTVFRDNPNMPRPPDMPNDLDTIGKRVRWWRERRKMARSALAKRVGYKSVSGLSDLELGESNASEKLHLIAATLGLNPHYVQTGDGEPESSFPQEPPPASDEWPFPAVPRTRLKKLTKIERSYAETRLLEALAEIESERRNRTG